MPWDESPLTRQLKESRAQSRRHQNFNGDYRSVRGPLKPHSVKEIPGCGMHEPKGHKAHDQKQHDRYAKTFKDITPHLLVL